VILGLVASVIGVADPLEGSPIILIGSALALAGALLDRSRQRKWLSWAFALTCVGVAALFGLSALGGIGGDSGRSYGWGLVLLPYPVGWLMTVVGAVRYLRGR